MAQWSGSAAALRMALPEITPAVLIRPQQLRRRAQSIVDGFPGEVFYAVKCNDAPVVLQALFEGGVRAFDVASISEIRAVRQQFGDRVRLAFMHPVKAAAAIREAYVAHGVRRFAFDHEEELDKILAATDGAYDLELVLRIAVPAEGSALPLRGKFGASPEEAVALLGRARSHAALLGITFHVGSQCEDPEAFAVAVRLAGEIAARAGGIDLLDVGGGFAARYRGHEPEFARYVEAIERSRREAGLAQTCLACEPGRVLVADGASVLVRVELRRGHALYIDDGVYGNLAELRWLGPCFPIRALRDGRVLRGPIAEFDLFGPTCDSIDSMPGPHLIVAEVQTGDLLEIGMAGAYAQTLCTHFNGFEAAPQFCVDDPAWYVADHDEVAMTA